VWQHYCTVDRKGYGTKELFLRYALGDRTSGDAQPIGAGWDARALRHQALISPPTWNLQVHLGSWARQGSIAVNE